MIEMFIVLTNSYVKKKKLYGPGFGEPGLHIGGGGYCAAAGCLAIMPESTSAPTRERVWKYILAPAISTSMKVRSVSKPLSVTTVLFKLFTRNSPEEPSVK